MPNFSKEPRRCLPYFILEFDSLPNLKLPITYIAAITENGSVFLRTMREMVLLRMPVQFSIVESRDQDSERGLISINEFVGLSASKSRMEIESESPLESVYALY